MPWVHKMRFLLKKISVLLLVGTSTLVCADVTDLVDVLQELPAEAELIKNGVPVPLVDDAQAKLVENMKTLLKTCRIDSKTRPSAFRRYNGGLPFDWYRASDPLRGTSFIKVSLGKLQKMVAGNKSVYAKQLMMETPAGNWPEKYIVAYDGRGAIQFSKCSSLVVVDIICMPGVRENMPKDYMQACKVLPGGDSDSKSAAEQNTLNQ